MIWTNFEMFKKQFVFRFYFCNQEFTECRVSELQITGKQSYTTQFETRIYQDFIKKGLNL